MQSQLARIEGAATPTRSWWNILRRGALIGTTAAQLALSGCSAVVDSPAAQSMAGAPVSKSAVAALGEDPVFDACIGALTPVCKTLEMNTAETMQMSCKATEFIPIPLQGGGAYGPMVVEGGPYGAKIEWNQGAGTSFVNKYNLAEGFCSFGIDAYGEPSSVTANLKNKRGLDATLYTIFRPACMHDGEKFPVITWANGTCGFTHGYAILLGTLASHGFVVIASNSSWTNTGVTAGVQQVALDYAAALNDDPNSVLYQHLDLSNIGAMGHSQGAQATDTTAKDPRVKAAIFWNGGTSLNKPFLNVSGDKDDKNPTVASVKAATEASSQPGAWLYYHQVLQTGGSKTGQLVLMEQPDRVWEVATSWWKWQLKGDETAKQFFVGPTCGLCGRDAEFEFGVNRWVQ